MSAYDALVAQGEPLRRAARATTLPLQADATAADVEAALEALGSIDDVAVTRSEVVVVEMLWGSMENMKGFGIWDALLSLFYTSKSTLFAVKFSAT